jgi:TrmH family RNA methyltransferase
MLLDGAHLLEEALDSGIQVDVVAVHDAIGDDPAAALAGRAERGGALVVTVTDSVLKAISPVRQPSGVVSIARRRPTPLEAVMEGVPQLVLMLGNVQDPGNVGAIVRAADACGATGVVTSAGTADPFGWKALRGSMGSAFRLPVTCGHDIEAAARHAAERGLRVYAAVPRDGTPLPRCDLIRPAAVLLGGEGAGLPPGVLQAADERLTIPMRPAVESLNVATAAALVVYEAQRQRAQPGSCT